MLPQWPAPFEQRLSSSTDRIFLTWLNKYLSVSGNSFFFFFLNLEAYSCKAYTWWPAMFSSSFLMLPAGRTEQIGIRVLFFTLLFFLFQHFSYTLSMFVYEETQGGCRTRWGRGQQERKLLFIPRLPHCRVFGSSIVELSSKQAATWLGLFLTCKQLPVERGSSVL